MRKHGAKVKITQKETEKSIEYTIPDEDSQDLFTSLNQKNHLSGLFAYYSILNQEFFNYVISCNLTGRQSKVLFFLLASAGLDGQVDLTNEHIARATNLDETNVSREVNFLVKKKIILKRRKRSGYEIKINYEEIHINHDMINPQFLFKNKVTKDTVDRHKALIQQETPYIKQYNLFDGGIDMINPDTGEVFFHYTKEEIDNHKVGTLKPPLNIKAQPAEAFEFEEAVVIEETKPEPEPKRLYRVRQKEE